MKIKSYRYLDSDSRITISTSPYFPSPNRVQNEADHEARCRLFGRRLGAVAAVLVFIACYIAGIVQYGVLLGVGIGWLPSAIIAWLSALAIAPLGTFLSRHFEWE